MEVFSDGRSTPAPTLAQLMTLTQAELLELTCPASRRVAERVLSLRDPEEPVLPRRATRIQECSQCFALFEVPATGRLRKTCSDRCHVAASHANTKIPRYANCVVCGNEFRQKVGKRKTSKRVTCSEQCLAAHILLSKPLSNADLDMYQEFGQLAAADGMGWE